MVLTMGLAFRTVRTILFLAFISSIYLYIPSYHVPYTLNLAGHYSTIRRLFILALFASKG